MATDQQRETRRYFSENAEQWHSAVQADDADKLNTLRQRYDFVVASAERAGPVRRFLDLGCGSGDLTVLMAERGADAVGIDFAPEMIEIARRFADQRRVADHCRFAVGSALDFERDGDSYDLVAALGLIEYFSLDETRAFLDRCRALLRDGGALVLESRNRLFNLVSFNAYTQAEIESGNLAPLMAEALAMVGAADMSECIAAITGLGSEPDILDTYPRTGVPVSTRHQFTPGQICRWLADAGFAPVSVSPYHYHVAPPAFLVDRGALHAEMARRMQREIVDCHQVLPHASSFLVEARKR